MNRLAHETSPYLRQHRHHPVDWYPWGDDAFAEARRRDRPILLSVGYSACHWCHVMAHESFEDATTAELMNRLFVNVKVDREERPDVDAIYMQAVQAMSGGGGWPMTVFLTPDGRPFFGGTYYPPTARGAMASFTQLMGAVDEAWSDRRDEVEEQAGLLVTAIERASRFDAASPGDDPDVLSEAAAAAIGEAFDPDWGGFGGAPKFPAAMTLDAALRMFTRGGHDELLDIVITSLDAMASGGIYDHLGGGFSRYSVDRRWLVPHFEKMLYDNALLVRTYLHAWQVTGEIRFRQVVDETIEYVLRDLRHPDGGFYSAEDADSEGVEGRFYVWSHAELVEVCEAAGLDAAEVESVIAWYGVTEAGNFEGANILVRSERGDLSRPDHVQRARAALLERRDARTRPGLDDKVLTEWNALMLVALAEAAAATGDDRWRSAAVANGEFLLAELRRPDGRWLRSWQSRTGEGPARARHLAYAHDHAALVDAFVELGSLTGQARWVTAARDTADALLELFWDAELGGVFTTGDDAELLITRPKELMDNATPSAQSLTAVALARLGALVGDARYTGAAAAVAELVGDLPGRHPTGFGHMLAAIDLVRGTHEVVVVGDRPDLVAEFQRRYLPRAVLAWGEPFDSPLWQARSEGFAYVCRDFTCRAPVDTVSDLVEQLSP